MLTQGFTVSLSPLALLKKREKGVISHLKKTDENLLNKLTAMGITPGLPISLERKFPSLIIKVGLSRLAIDKDMASSIYVRLNHS
jgi:ferrous iron transport protein A